MRTQRRNKRTIYLCHKYIDENGLVKYKEPIMLKENYNSTNTDADLIAMGMDYPSRLRIKADNRAYVNGEWINRSDLYHVGDRLYIFVNPPEKHDVLCKTADYQVELEPILEDSINQSSIMLIKLSGKNKN